jgi:glycosyltransferase involved in cell wall biosynthesis
MRLGFYTYTFLPTVGGAEILLHALAGSLAGRGHEVTVWAPRVRGRENRIAARYRLRRYGRHSSKRFGVRQTLPRLLVETWGRRPDVLHCHGAYPAGYIGAAFKRLTGTPVVIRPHGADILPGEWIAGDARLAARMQRALFAADAVVRSLWEAHQPGLEDHAMRLWALLVFEVWFQTWMTSPQPEAPHVA